jgi:hypothetical protein
VNYIPRILHWNICGSSNARKSKARAARGSSELDLLGLDNENLKNRTRSGGPADGNHFSEDHREAPLVETEDVGVLGEAYRFHQNVLISTSTSLSRVVCEAKCLPPLHILQKNPYW